jgi:hypothetical protein
LEHQFGSSPTCAIRRAGAGVEGRIQSQSQREEQTQTQKTWSPPASDAVKEEIAVIGSLLDGLTVSRLSSSGPVFDGPGLGLIDSTSLEVAWRQRQIAATLE